MISVPVPYSTRAKYAYQARVSRFKFGHDVFRQWRVEIFRHGEEITVPTGEALAHRLSNRQQPRHWNAIPRDHDFFSSLDASNEFGELGLRFMDIHGEHVAR